MTPRDFLEAARVPPSVSPQEFGLWTIERRQEHEWAAHMPGLRLGWPDYTLLRRTTLATLHLAPQGEIVMEDSERELRRHLPIWLRARGRVLVTGLGLGCVVRGLLASPAVDHIDVVEIDADILRIIGAEFAADPRVTLYHADALKITWPYGTRWDFAWHDLWIEEGALQVLHAELIVKHRDNVGKQGAWMLPHHYLKHLDLDIVGGRRR